MRRVFGLRYYRWPRRRIGWYCYNPDSLNCLRTCFVWPYPCRLTKQGFVVSPAYISDALATVIYSVTLLVCPVSREALLRSSNLCQHQIHLTSYPHDNSAVILKD